MRKWGKRLLVAVLALSMVNPAPMAVNVQAKEKKAVEIDVTDFGADPSGKYDSTEAVMEALEEAKTIEGDKVLNFPYGEYRFDKDHALTRVYHTSNTSSRSYPEKKISILLEEVEDLTIEGNDSTLLIYGDIMALAVVESSDIKMQNFVLDYKDADTVDISVVKTDVDANGNPYADIYIPAAYNYEISADGKHIEWQGELSAETGKPYWTWEDADFGAYLVVYKGYDRTVIRANDKTASNPFAGVKNIAPSGESTVRFTYTKALPTDIVEGNIYQLSNSAWRQTAGAFFWESEDLTVENIDVHYLSGFGWLTQMCKNVEFKGVDFLPRDGSGKYTTSNADQLHVSGCGGYFKVTDCNFSMAHDDPINVHGTYMRVEEVIDSKTLKMKYIHSQQGGFKQFHEDDEVLFYSRTYLEAPDGQTEVQPFVVASSVGPGEVYNGSKLDLVTEIVTFKEELPEETIADLRKTVVKNKETQPLYVAENVTYTPAVTIKGNRMKSIPTRGILCTTRQEVIIEDNIFDNMAMANIFLSNDADSWYESGPIRNLTIRNNTFYIRPTGQTVDGSVPGILIKPITIPSGSLKGGTTTPKDPENLVHENITIEGNTFYISNDNVITANRVDGLTIKNNTIIHEDPSLAITVDTKSGLVSGKSNDVDVTVSETVLQKDVFQFNDCKNVVVEGNSYDEGMNLNIQMDTKMDSSDLTLGKHEKDVLTVSRTEDNFVTSEGKVQLLSTNPEVAYIDHTGKLVGVKAGETTVFAYIEKNGALIKSNEVKVTVESAESAKINLSAEKTYFTTEGERAVLSTDQENVTFTVTDPITGKATDKGSVVDGVYSAKKDGAVLVKAVTESSSEEILMINSFEKSYGDKAGLAEGIYVDNPTDGGTTSTDKYSVTIIPQNNGNGIYAAAALVNNIVHVTIPEELRADLRIQVTAAGLVTYGKGWDSSGILLYTDLDNFVFVAKRNHIAGVSTMYEKNAVAEEYAGNTNANTLTETTFEIVVEGTTAKIRYQDVNGTWQDVRSFDISHLQTADMKFGLASWLHSGAGCKPTYSNLRIAKASETTEDMSNVEPIAFYQSFENERPNVQSITLTAGNVNEKATASIKGAVDEDGSISGALYEWTLTSKSAVTKTYTTNGAFIPLEAGTLSVRGIVFDDYNKPSKATESAVAKIKASDNTADALQNLYFNGNAVEGFQEDVYEYDVYVPAGMGHFVISVDQADAEKITEVIGRDKVKPAVGSNHVTVLANDSYIIKCGSETYQLHVHSVENSDNAVTAISVGNTQVDLTDEIKTGTDSYFVQVDEDIVELKITTAEGVQDIDVTRSYFEYQVEDKAEASHVFAADVEMKAGIQAFYVYITAADGISVREVKVYLFRDSYTDSSLKGISINGKALEDFDLEKEDYVLRMSVEDAKALVITADAKAEQQTSITVNRKRTEGNEITTVLESGLNEVVITNVAKNLWSKNFYTLNVIVDSPDNAELLTLNTSERMKPAFDSDTTAYELTNNTGKFTVSAAAQSEEAEIEMSLLGSEQNAKGKGTLSHEFDLYEGDNYVMVKVTAKDGKTKRTYQLKVTARGAVYASDVIYTGELEGITNTKTKVGYGNVTLDTNVDGNTKISLLDENGMRVVFDKGIGAHASSEIIYQFEEGHAFKTFEAYAGIDYAKYVYDGSSVSFEVWVDGTKAYDSAEVLGSAVRVTTPMQFVQVDVEGAGEVKLITKEVDNNAYDHSEWADACFTRSLPENPNSVTPEIPGTSKAVTEVFADITEGAWYVDFVQYVYDHGIMSGNAGLFKPTENITRAQVVTTLYNLEGKPAVTDFKACNELKDVANDAWYTNAVCWAYNIGVATGNDSTKMFYMNNPITRQQLATFLYRYAEYKGFDVTASVDISDMLNADKVADYAATAVKWTVAVGIISGSEKTDAVGNKVYDLKPTSNATRAQMAAILMRFAESKHL